MLPIVSVGITIAATCASIHLNVVVVGHCGLKREFPPNSTFPGV